MFPFNVWRVGCIVFFAVSAVLGLALFLNQGKVVTQDVQSVRIVAHNVYIEKEYDRDTGVLIRETITDKTVENEKSKTVIKPADKKFIITGGYNIIQGNFVAGGGIVWANTIVISAVNPVALRFEPIIMVSILF